MSKHTPGPWRVSVRHSINSTEPPAYHIASEERNSPTNIMLANKNLISAAPEMLAALKVCYAFFKEGSPIHPGTISFSDDDSVDAQEFFKRLIAKATGGKE